jgi:hypothetical protein
MLLREAVTVCSYESVARRLIVPGIVASIAIATAGMWVAACTGHEPVFPPGADGSAESGAGIDSGDATPTPAPDAGDAQPSDGGADGCALPMQQTPCGCTGTRDCCLQNDNAHTCYDVGTAPCLGSGTAKLIACVGGQSCSPNQTCCLAGSVLDNACPRKISLTDTACNDRVGSANPCGSEPVLCADEADCTVVGLTTCVPAVMGSAPHVFGVCVP